MTDPLAEVAALVEAQAGMVIRESQLPALAAAIGRVAPGLTPEALLARARRPQTRAEIVERLIDEVTIKETFFLRHPDELEAVDWRAVATRAQSRGRPAARVWSAACASGEEPYTLALLALEAFASGRAPIDILATDIARTALARAQAGHYGLRSVRHVDDARRRRWFIEQGRGLTVGDELRAHVRFARHNLLRDAVPPAGETPFDIIVCRNVLIYFTPEVVRAIVRRLESALAPDGLLILGAADRLSGGPDAMAPRAPTPRRATRAEAPPRPRRPRPRPRPAPAPPPAGLDADTEYERGLAALAAGDAEEAAATLRRALYLAPDHAPAAFQLARAHEARGDVTAARRAYWQALALLDDAGEEVGGVARRDLESAARARLDALGRG